MAYFQAALMLTALGASVLDSDADGVNDAADAYPCDASASAQIFAPGAGQHALLLFEDRWPARGDLDFNDVVLAWSVVMRANAAGQVVAVRVNVDPLALGGILDHGLGLRLPVPRSSLASASRSVDGGPPTALALTADPQLTVRVSPNLRELFAGTAGQINSTSADPRRQGQLVTIEVRFAQPVSLSAASAPFDLFVFRADDLGHEIHRPIYGGTADMDAALFGTEDDGSTGTRHFVDDAGLPFALAIPADVAYPAEGVEIASLFPQIVAFAASGGSSATNFYTSPVGSAAYVDSQGNGVLSPRFFGERIPDACNECPSGHCVAPSCTDGIQNGSERQIDCGGACAIPEACNGVDDDCDGQVDQGDPGGGVTCPTGQPGACGVGTTQCGGGALSCRISVAPTTESCNGVDDDCDGVVDEGVCVTTDEFTANSGLWTHEVAYGSAYAASWGGGFMTVASPNNSMVRTRQSGTLEGDFDMTVTGRAFWTGSNVATHIKGFVGLYHAGATSNAALQYRAFFDNSQVFAGDTHYGVDLNALLGAASGVTRTFSLRFTKVGTTIRVYSIVGTTETLRSTLTLASTSAPLRLEIVHTDGTSSANGHVQLDRWESIRTF